MHQSLPHGEKVFDDRRSAGKELAEALITQADNFHAILGLTRGGVPVAFEVASAMHIPLDAIVIKKLRAPNNPELAIGAVSSNGGKVLRNSIIRQLGVSEKYLAAETEGRTAEAKADEKNYRGNHQPLDINGCSVAIVDDGIATGSSIEAAVLSARQKGANRITVATPVASQEACSALRSVADDVFCLTTPADF
ncbi:MAG: phosphoribosyltransferase family protein, partial [Dehalococcoidia bacterium]|nr:phosphoribosyltransferase family protein [Dehalococcoidia bacterium]